MHLFFHQELGTLIQGVSFYFCILLIQQHNFFCKKFFSQIFDILEKKPSDFNGFFFFQKKKALAIFWKIVILWPKWSVFQHMKILQISNPSHADLCNKQLHFNQKWRIFQKMYQCLEYVNTTTFTVIPAAKCLQK